MDEKTLQGIYDLLEPMLPEMWNNLIFRADYTEGSYSMKFYVDFGNGVYKDCYSLAEVSKMQLIKAFMQINSIIEPERKKLQDKWSIMTLTINVQGKFKSEFDYRNISENALAYQEEWEKKYIGK